MERYSVVRFKAGMGLASDMGLRFKVTDIDGDRIELHHDRSGYRFAEASKLEPWVDGAIWNGSKYVDPVTSPEEWVRSVDPVYASDPNAPTTVLVDRDTVTLRDRFAIAALRIYVSLEDLTYDGIANASYRVADAMLAARNASHVTG